MILAQCRAMHVRAQGLLQKMENGQEVRVMKGRDGVISITVSERIKLSDRTRNGLKKQRHLISAAGGRYSRSFLFSPSVATQIAILIARVLTEKPPEKQ